MATPVGSSRILPRRIDGSIWTEDVGFAPLWITPSELNALPVSGAAFDRLQAGAQSSWGTANLSLLDNNHNVLTLSGALYAARTADPTILAKTQAALASIIGSPLATVLEMSRNLGTYVIAADIIDYQDSAFRAEVRRLVDLNLNGHSGANSLRETALYSANNWGGHARASLAAAGLYLGDQTMIDDVIKGYEEFIGTYTGGNPEMVWTTTEWHFDDLDQAGVNRADAGVLSGVIPEDWRRDLAFDPTTAVTLADMEAVTATYLWEAMQGFAVTSVLLHRQGFVDLSAGNNALQRAADVLIATAHPALGDDRWMPYLFNQYGLGTYDTSAGIQEGKNMGWTDYTGQG